jgi:hypothetical protein
VHPSAEIEVAFETSEHVEVAARHAPGDGAPRREHGQILLGNHHDKDLPVYEKPPPMLG